jgi:Spy/CpxP family protein refolding chaperone
MKKVLLFFALVIIVAGVAAFCATRWVENRTVANDIAAHDWLHRELKLTDAQHEALKPIETKFAERQRGLAAALRDANVQLAKAMGEEKGYTPRVAAAVEHVHHCMGDLQKASIEHVFEMRAVLSPEQGDKLLRLAQQSLEQSP